MAPFLPVFRSGVFSRTAGPRGSQTATFNDSLNPDVEAAAGAADPGGACWMLGSCGPMFSARNHRRSPHAYSVPVPASAAVEPAAAAGPV